jgi:hypothetical protein
MVTPPWVMVGQTSVPLAASKGQFAGLGHEEHRLPHHLHVFGGCIGGHLGDVGVEQRGRRVGAGIIAVAGTEPDGTNQGAATH